MSGTHPPLKAPRIYVDFDDVLCETARLLMDIASREFGRDLVFEQIRTFDIGKAFDLENHEVRRVMNLLHDPELLISLDPMVGARESLVRWAENGARVDIVTGRPPMTREASEAWLKQHDVPYQHMIFVDKYSRQFPELRDETYVTLEDLQKSDYDLAVEDAPHMLDFLYKEMTMDVAVFSRPWNRTVELPLLADARTVVRCNGWNDVMLNFPFA